MVQPYCAKRYDREKRVDLERIKALIELVASQPIAEMTLADGESRIRLVKAPVADTRPVPPAPAAVSATKPASPPPLPAAAGEDGLVRAPMPGIFHRAPAPGEPPFVAEGVMVEPGRPLCVIEAMKVFNAVPAGRGGRIEAVLAGNGEMVRADQPLFRIG